MTSMQSELPGPSRPWQGEAWVQVLAVVAGVLPLYSGLIIHQLRQDQMLSVRDLVVYLAVVSPLAIVVALLLLKFLCGEKPGSLNLRSGRLSSDLLAALALSVTILFANVVSSSLLAGLFPDTGSGTSLRDLLLEVAARPGLLALFVGPLVLLGAASEELIRVFLLSRLYKVWPSTGAKSVAVVISACLFGLIHFYRGPAHIIWAALFGLIAGFYYLRFGRVIPLILAHYATNALQVIVIAATAE